MKKKSKSFSVTIQLIVLIFLLIWPINLFIFMETSELSDNMIKQASLNTQNVLNVCLSELDGEIKKTDYLLYFMRRESPNGLTMWKQEGDSDYVLAKVNFFWELSRQANLLDSADGYGFHMKKMDDWIYWSKNNTSQNQELWKKIEASDFPQNGWTFHKIDGSSLLVKIVDTDTSYFGAFIRLDSILEELALHMEYGNGEIFFSNEVAIADSQTIPLHAISNRSNVILNALLKKQDILGNTTFLQKIEQTFSFLSFFLIILLYFFLRWLLVVPLKTINYAHRKLEQGNLDYQITQKAHSAEYQYVYDSYNIMTKRLKSLTIENYEKKLQNKKMEIQNLQLQIRPHFLLNMFNMIYTMAQNREYVLIQNTIVYLSDYFRYIFREGRELDFLSKELSLVRRYLDIAALRYPNRIEVEFDLNPKVDVIRIPPLLIHNLVENIIKHALNPDDVTNILIHTSYQKYMAIIEISDDGIGMNADTLEQLKKFLQLPDSKMKLERSHIGIKNSIFRLKHYYGETASLTIKSELGLGTSVFLKIPYDLEVHDDSSDCK